MKKSLATLKGIELLSELDSDLGRHMADVARKGDLMSMMNLSSESVSTGLGVDSFQRDYAAAELFSKSDFLDLEVDRKAAALDKFLEAEDQCRATNHRVSRFNSEVFSFASLVPQAIQLMVRKIESCLGTFSWDECDAYFGFGPGACVGLPRAKGHAVYKYGCLQPSVTGLCLDLGLAAIRSRPPWATRVLGLTEGGPTVVCGNKVTTVPKSWKTDRVIAIEPALNMYIQRGIGRVIRNRLRRRGVNLDDQTRNQRLALQGSVDGSLATLDLSAASDSIALSLVDLLLPPDWGLAIKLTRSQFGTLPSGERIRYQKVSSMGNGFTFELESLIFWALCSAVCQSLGLKDATIGVYGDDLIVPVEAVEGVQELLSYLGFTLNAKKSFWTGPFRESCGKHYFSGRDVTPIYLRKEVDRIERQIWFTNSVARLAHRFKGGAWGRCASLERFYTLQRSFLPRFVVSNPVPWCFGDVSICMDLDEACPDRAPSFLDGWVVRIPRIVHKGPSEDFTLSSLDLLERVSDDYGDFGSERPLPSRPVNRSIRAGLTRTIASQWDSVGPWW